MLKEETVTRGMVVEKKTTYVPEEIVGMTAIKKEKVLSIASLGTQLNLLGTVVEQIGNSIGLNTSEFILAKQKFAEIKAALGQ